MTLALRMVIYDHTFQYAGRQEEFIDDHDLRFAGQWHDFPDILTNYQQTHVELMDRQRPD